MLQRFPTKPVEVGEDSTDTETNNQESVVSVAPTETNNELDDLVNLKSLHMEWMDITAMGELEVFTDL